MPQLLVVRLVAVGLLATAAGLVALSGCGKPTPRSTTNPDTPNPSETPTTKPTSNDSPQPSPPTTLRPVEPSASEAQTAFLRDLIGGQADATRLSQGFVRVVGKPLVFPDDKKLGYSPSNATSWLKAVGEGLTLGAELQRQQAGDVVFFRGSVSGPRFGKEPGTTGGYSLRMVREQGTWKVDWLSLSSAEMPPRPAATTPVQAAQDFVVTAFLETVCDLHGLTRQQRAPLIAATLAPELRTQWAPPFEQDLKDGYDYNPGKIGLEAVKIGGGTSTFTFTRSGDAPEFHAELTKPAGKKNYLIKLTPGNSPMEWRVRDVSEVTSPKN
ncbi:MAG: hypothetical protein RMJ56_13410 [Gemmataceae bacterium]|nr:hypothetical protein [Gemmata sp.]MDW8198590.1 hypothetical protein [Gemmataceae bacterium]